MTVLPGQLLGTLAVRAAIPARAACASRWSPTLSAASKRPNASASLSPGMHDTEQSAEPHRGCVRGARRAHPATHTCGACGRRSTSCLELLDSGTVRVAEKKHGQWVVNEWLKKAVLLYFRSHDSAVIDGRLHALL